MPRCRAGAARNAHRAGALSWVPAVCLLGARGSGFAVLTLVMARHWRAALSRSALFVFVCMRYSRGTAFRMRRLLRRATPTSFNSIARRSLAGFYERYVGNSLTSSMGNVTFFRILGKYRVVRNKIPNMEVRIIL